MSQVLIVANWKMNPATLREAKKLLQATRTAAERATRVRVIVAPPSIFLRELASTRSTRIAFAAQNAHFEREGAYTGEISMLQAKDARASFVLVGHAERRAAGETNEDTRKKISAALAVGLTPILCVGESKREQGGEHFEVIRSQLKSGFADVPDAKFSKVLVAYEPVWAIGAEKPMHSRDVHEMSIFIRKTLIDARGDVGHAVKILYGGSVDETNAKRMCAEGGVAGLLLGRASISMKHLTPFFRAL